MNSYLILLKFVIKIFEKIISFFDKRSVFSSVYIDLEKDLKANFNGIKKEFLNFYKSKKSSSFVEISYQASGKILEKDDYQKWKTVFLRAYGKPILENETFFPITVNLLNKYKKVITLAFFSCMEPNLTIKPHRGPYKGVLRLHHGLIIPETQDTYIIVDNKKYFWINNESFIFDDTFIHSAYNFSNNKRVVLFLDIIRPLPIFLDKINRLIIKLISKSSLGKDLIENSKIFYEQYNKQ